MSVSDHAAYRCGAPDCGACAGFPETERSSMSLSAVPRSDDTPTPPKAPAKPIVLPAWIDEAREWVDSTKRLSKKLAEEDAQASAEVRQIRTLRQLVDTVLERIEPPTGAQS